VEAGELPARGQLRTDSEATTGANGTAAPSSTVNAAKAHNQRKPRGLRGAGAESKSESESESATWSTAGDKFEMTTAYGYHEEFDADGATRAHSLPNHQRFRRTADRGALSRRRITIHLRRNHFRKSGNITQYE
jgi:hypothetical protein